MRIILAPLCLLVLGFGSQAREAYERPSFGDNWAAGFSVGVASPIKGHSFFRNMRPTIGANIDKHLTPAFSLGAEMFTGFNSSRWPGAVYSSTAFDNMYLGLYGSLDFIKLGVPACASAPFGFGVQAGCGWGHDFRTSGVPDHNYFATKAGLFFRYNITHSFAVSLSPSMIWDMSDARTAASSAAYSASKAIFQLQAGIRYSFGGGFSCPRLYDVAQVEALNGQINNLRADLNRARADVADVNAKMEALKAELYVAKSQKPEIIKEVAVNNRLNTELDVFFLLGSSKVMPDQMPNVERIATYLKNHPGSRVVIKGYASRDGNADANMRLASRRAEAVKAELINRYGVKPSRISASGAGIGDLFEEESWNRVSVCTLEN